MATILVVEDDPISQLILSTQLRQAEHTVVIASSGKSAQTLLVEVDCDLMIVDKNLPDMDGLALLHQLREQADYVTLPVIMLTTSELAGDLNEARSTGANAFLVKPSSATDLLETINRLLSARSDRTEETIP